MVSNCKTEPLKYRNRVSLRARAYRILSGGELGREDVDEGCTKTEKAPHSLTHSLTHSVSRPPFFAVSAGAVAAGAVHSDGTRFGGARADAAESYRAGPSYCSWVLSFL